MDDFKATLMKHIAEKGRMTTQEVYALFPSMNRKTVSWHLHEYINKGLLEKRGHGVYALTSSIPRSLERRGKVTELCGSAIEHLDATGLEYYVSGLDCMNGRAFTVDGTYPVIVCSRKNQVKDVQLALMREFDFAMTESETDILDNDSIRHRIQFVVLGSEDFSLQKEHFAFKEKAFVDLYYAATRLEYPLPIEELPHILKIIQPNPYRFRLSTKDRGLSNELNFLLSYNKRFLAEFVKYL